MKIILLKAILFGLLLSASHLSNAAIMVHDTHTTVNSIDWLKFTATINMTQTEALMANPGWRTATRDEMESMMNTMLGTRIVWDVKGFGSYNGYQDTEWLGVKFRTYFGETYYGDPGPSIASVEGLGLVGILGYADGGFAGYSGSIDSHWSDVGHKAPYHGIALVRNSPTPVPESSTLAIFSLGMIGFALRRLKKSF